MANIGPTADVWANYFVHATRRILVVGIHTSGTIGTGDARYTLTASWLRPDPVTPGQPQFQVGTVVLPEQFADPFLDPYSRAQPEIAYGSRPKADSRAAFGQKPAVDFFPGGPPGGVPGTYVPAPPKPPNKEKKEPPFNYGFPGKLYGALTEAGDAAACYIEAKGGEAKGGTRSKFKQAWRIANDPEAQPFDPEAFAKCMAREQAQDAAIGRLSGGAAKAQNRSPYASKRPGGYRGGGWGTRMH